MNINITSLIRLKIDMFSEDTDYRVNIDINVETLVLSKYVYGKISATFVYVNR